ncbi:MAG: hypothetical protein JO366_13925 [Methylobacteriaceae bacterium]|nr:hypothetical protein [Methylobacteriaceae bacterium]
MKVYLDGRPIFDTGCVSGGGSKPFQVPAAAKSVRIDVQPNCQGNTKGTAWNFTLLCPKSPPPPPPECTPIFTPREWVPVQNPKVRAEVIVTSGHQCKFSFNPRPPLILLSNTIVSQPQQGNVAKQDDNHWSYTSKPGFTGKDSFTMIRVLNDPGAGKLGTVTITYEVIVK